MTLNPRCLEAKLLGVICVGQEMLPVRSGHQSERGNKKSKQVEAKRREGRKPTEAFRRG